MQDPFSGSTGITHFQICGHNNKTSDVEAKKPYERMAYLAPLGNLKLWLPKASTAGFTYADVYAIEQL